MTTEAVRRIPPAEGIANEAPASLAQRKLAVMAGVRTLAKDGHAKIGNGGYAYVSHDQITQMLRPLMAEHGIAVSATMMKPDGGTFGVVVTLQNADDSDDTEGSEWYLPAPSMNGPQGIGAVISYAVKYALSKTFLVDAGDEDLDNQRHAGAEREAVEKAKAEPLLAIPTGEKQGTRFVDLTDEQLQWTAENADRWPGFEGPIRKAVRLELDTREDARAAEEAESEGA